MSEKSIDILIAEDSPTQAERLRHLLEGRGYHVTAAVNGQEALAGVRRHRPALVLSDVEMPVMDGYGMCRALKDDAQLRDVPVILLTSFADPAAVLRGLEAGADAYLTKPYDGEFLLDRVAAVLSDCETVQESSESAVPFRVVFAGRRHLITAAPRQVLTLLLSTYANAVQQNRELGEAKQRLQDQNKLLESAVRAEHDAHEALKHAQANLVQTEKLASLGQMVAGVAHEINNPLAFVANNVAVLQRDFMALRGLLTLYSDAETKLDPFPELTAPIQEYRERIDLPYTLSNLADLLSRSRDGLQRIEQIVKNLRDFARLDEGDLSSVDLNAGIQQTANIMQTKAREKGVKLELIPGPLPAVTCYAAKINQAVLNLLSNAIDACTTGGEVAIRTTADGDSVAIDVVDNGSGIAPSIRDKIFDPFFTTKPIGQGTGLGLSITYGIVHEHGGTITVESSPGAGSRFTVVIPTRGSKAA
jgi:two-component system, NtrC family, sensor kinase